MVGAQAVPQYGMENGYGSYEQQTEYPSYQQDYKQSYGKDNSYKSKDSVSIKKLNCINTNFVNLGNNTGDFNIGNNGRVAEGAQEGANVGGWNGGEEGYNDYGNTDGYY